MKLLNNYLEELNTYPRFKKSKIKKILNSYTFKVMAISFLLLILKILAEIIVEAYIL